MTTPLSHVGQTARPEDPQQQAAQSPGAQGHRQQQQGDHAQRSAVQQQQRECQQHLVDAEDDPASDANTESANHPNDDD
ncbi:hypothetical protein ACS5PN_07775 [Roseateles sp. NT4]|uniref:hypothetical protein n=1 Tax=Roseateles sp. NT4 TaxID=3453715 RepID=UPI003EEB4F7B